MTRNTYSPYSIVKSDPFLPRIRNRRMRKQCDDFYKRYVHLWQISKRRTIDADDDMRDTVNASVEMLLVSPAASSINPGGERPLSRQEEALRDARLQLFCFESTY